MELEGLLGEVRDSTSAADGSCTITFKGVKYTISASARDSLVTHATRRQAGLVRTADPAEIAIFRNAFKLASKDAETITFKIKGEKISISRELATQLEKECISAQLFENSLTANWNLLAILDSAPEAEKDALKIEVLEEVIGRQTALRDLGRAKAAETDASGLNYKIYKDVNGKDITNERILDAVRTQELATGLGLEFSTVKELKGLNSTLISQMAGAMKASGDMMYAILAATVLDANGEVRGLEDLISILKKEGNFA